MSDPPTGRVNHIRVTSKNITGLMRQCQAGLFQAAHDRDTSGLLLQEIGCFYVRAVQSKRQVICPYGSDLLFFQKVKMCVYLTSEVIFILFFPKYKWPPAPEKTGVRNENKNRYGQYNVLGKGAIGNWCNRQEKEGEQPSYGPH